MSKNKISPMVVGPRQTPDGKGLKEGRESEGLPPGLSPDNVKGFVESLFPEDIHAKRILSLSNAAVGVLQAGAVGVHAIGRGLAAARGLEDKHAIKQVDRLIGNQGIDVSEVSAQWVPYVIANRARIRVNMDWTEFDHDDHTMLVLSLQTKHGRSTPLLWKTFVKSKLKGQRNAHEDELLVRLAEVVPEGVRVTIVADRGFADHKLYEFLVDELGFDFIIRFREVSRVTDATGETRAAKGWLGKDGRMRVLRNASVTAKHFPVATVVVVQEKGMQDAWCVVASSPSAKGSDLKRCYGKRFSCEETFRDMKDIRYGMGMSWQPISKPHRRDRMLLVASIAYVLLTILGEAGERTGLDRILKTNTSKKRTLSLFRQGARWFELIPTMPEDRLALLMGGFTLAMVEHSFLNQNILGVL